MSKTQVIDEEPQKQGQGTPADVGSYLEEGIMDWGTSQIAEGVYEGKVTVTKNQFRVKKGTNHSANCDGIVSVNGLPTAVFEIKSTNDMEGWGRPMTAEIPDHVNAQVQWQMYVTDLDHAWVAVLVRNEFGGMTFALHSVGRDDVLIEQIVHTVSVFWSDYVLTGEMPEGSAPKLSTLSRVRRKPEMEPLDTGSEEEFDRLCYEHMQLQKQVTQMQKELKESKARLLSFARDKEGCQSSDFTLTYATTARGEYTVPAKEVRMFRLKKRKRDE